MKTFLIAVFLLTCTIARADEIDDIIPAIIQVESGGNPNTVSNAGAIGLMQITPIVWKEWKEEEGNSLLTDRITFQDLTWGPMNEAVGQWYLRRLKNHYLKDHYTFETLLAAYNGGITRLRQVNYDISKMSKETRQYVKKVMKLYRKGETK